MRVIHWHWVNRGIYSQAQASFVVYLQRIEDKSYAGEALIGLVDTYRLSFTEYSEVAGVGSQIRIASQPKE